MKNNYAFLRFMILISVSFFSSEMIHGQFAYINPLPGSKYHNPQTTLAIRNGAFIDESSVHNKNWIEIIGSKSGEHQWSARLSDDKKTIVIKPQPVFDYGETVYVTIHSKLKNENGKIIEGKSFSFKIRDELTEEQQEENREAVRKFYRVELGYDPSQSVLRDNLDSLPTYTITTNNNAAPGEIFYNNQYDFNPNDTNCFATIIENDGTVVWAKNLTANGHDFKINYNGYLTYFTYGQEYWIIMDSNYNAIDSFQAGNGYGEETNPHDCSIYSDGHALLLVEDKQMVDMSQYGGPTNAIVIGVIVQELDANKDVVFEWSGWDHFQFTDADVHIHLNGGIVDYVHANAISRDNDGNLLLSCRNMSEVTKINPSTGDIIWRLGGENNQFAFVNDNISQHFSYQHDARRCDNGNITLFNNGNYLPVLRSSAKEYQLDEVNKVATLVWYYEHPDVSGYPVYGPATGSMQRLPNGNTMIDWGTTITQPDRPSMTEVDSSKNITWEMKFDRYGEKSYRVHKYVWNPCAPINATFVKVKKIMSTSVKVDWEPVKNASSYDLQFRKLGNTSWKLKNTVNTYKKLTHLIANRSYEYQLRTHCANGYVSDWTFSDTFTTAPVRYLFPDVTEVMKFEIYPNPVSDILYMQVDCDNDLPTTISIYDIAGKLIFTSGQIMSEDEELLRINISHLTSGYYLAQIRTGTANQTMKFVKE